MKVLSEYGSNFQSEVASTEVSSAKIEAGMSTKNFTDMSSGDKFKATIMDIQPNQVTIRLPSGDSFTARTMVLPDARIGEDTIFMVKENFKGQILLEMVKPDESPVQNHIIKETLARLGMHATNENIQLAKGLMKNNMPLDIDTVQKAAYFKYADHRMTMDKILFLLKEDFPMTSKSIDVLNEIMDKTLNLSQSVKGISAEIFKIEDSELKSELIRVVLGLDEENRIERNIVSPKEGQIPESITSDRLIQEIFRQKDFAKDGAGKFIVDPHGDKKEIIETLKSQVEQKLRLDFKNIDSVEKFSQYYKELYTTVEKMSRLLSPSSAYENLSAQISRTKDGIEFMNHVNQYKEYFQMPLSMDGTKNQGELYVFKDKKGSKNFQEQASVLISLDYARLGHIEVFINKAYKDLSLQFKAENENILMLINKNSAKLQVALNQKGYTISQFSLKNLSEHFKITDEMEPPAGHNATPKRYSFDMRV